MKERLERAKETMKDENETERIGPFAESEVEPR
jgi:hypothetical protein